MTLAFDVPSARSSSAIARSSLFVIGRGTDSSPHAAPCSAVSSVQRGVVHGGIVVVVVVVGGVVSVVVVVGTTTLVSAAKFSRPGVPVLAARTTSASDVPVAAFAAGWSTTVKSADPPLAMTACGGVALVTKPLSSAALRSNVPSAPAFRTEKTYVVVIAAWSSWRSGSTIDTLCGCTRSRATRAKAFPPASWPVTYARNGSPGTVTAPANSPAGPSGTAASGTS